MATSYLTPGVYVEEVDRGTKPIEGVGTSVAAFIGFTERASEMGRNGSEPVSLLNKATLVTNWNQYTSKFGGFVSGAYLPQSVYGYFANGGGRCYVISVAALGMSNDPNIAKPAQASLPSLSDAKTDSMLVKALQPGPAGNDINVTVEMSKTPEGEDGETFSLNVSRGGSSVERFDGLTMTSGEHNVETVVNTQSKTIRVETVRKSGKLAERRPAQGTYALQGGEIKSLVVQAPQFEGDTSRREGLGALEALDDITILCVPDLMTSLPARGYHPGWG